MTVQTLRHLRQQHLFDKVKEVAHIVLLYGRKVQRLLLRMRCRSFVSSHTLLREDLRRASVTREQGEGATEDKTEGKIRILGSCRVPIDKERGRSCPLPCHRGTGQ